MNENLFRQEKNVQKLKEHLKDYFALNMQKGTSMSMVWDAGKAFMRGILIQMNNVHRQKQIQKRKELEDEIKLKEKILISNPTDEKVKESIKLLKTQFNMLMADQTATNLLYMKQNTFCNANKPGRWLAYQLRKKQRQRIIDKINYNGKLVYHKDLIKKSFLDYYQKLYKSTKIQVLDIDNYLNEANFPKLTEDQKQEINGLVASEEIEIVIKELKLGKAPGTDGLTSIYYKTLV